MVSKSCLSGDENNRVRPVVTGNWNVFDDVEKAERLSHVILCSFLIKRFQRKSSFIDMVRERERRKRHMHEKSNINCIRFNKSLVEGAPYSFSARFFLFHVEPLFLFRHLNNARNVACWRRCHRRYRYIFFISKKNEDEGEREREEEQETGARQ